MERILCSLYTEVVLFVFFRLFLFVLFKNIGERLSETSESQREARILPPPLPLALAVRKSPAVFVFYHARSTDFEEKIEGL